MGSKNCMNEFCRATISSEWKKGWTLKSGGFATLCYNCGSAYENSIFCETFHSEESGWRDCKICRKRLHCGCIASRYLHEYMDLGGVGCVSCVKRSEIHQAPPIQISANITTSGTLVTNGIKDVDLKDQINGDKLSTERLLQLTKTLRINNVDSTLEHLKQEDPILKALESGKRATSLTPQQSLSKSDCGRTIAKNAHESFTQPSLNFTLVSPLGMSSPLSPFPLGNIEGSEHSKSPLQPGQRTRPSLQKPPKPSPMIGTDSTNKGSSSQVRVARPPVDGRGRNQLLPRYWPKITDQELQQLSGDLNSNIVPLFEKILSASDAGRIGRLVLPKACAEAYFPTINQSEGIPIRIQDIKGKEWTFQFRFWPNNNSRMYVLEGVTPCIQNMQLQAGDTVTFSRRDPGGQLVIGCRKSSVNVDIQDPQTPASENNGSLAETAFSGADENQRLKTGKTSDDSSLRHMSALDKKKAKNIKNKRLHMHSDDAMELRVTWEEAQELLRPSPSSEATIVLVEDHEFEEFEEPPVFGKKTIFISRSSGEHEQLVQCDTCLKWRRLPVHALLSANWTCSENIWDSNSYTCSTPEDINPRDLESFFKDSKKRKISDNKTPSKEGEPSGLDALATAAVLGDNMAEAGDAAGAATTRHPRHRPGCSCIVCIQPPSGKGKHEPTCKCNVCLTVRRRFKTLMLRKKKRMSEREAELNQEKSTDDKDRDPTAKIDLEREDIAGHALLNMVSNEGDANSNGNGNAVSNGTVDVNDKGKLDLNSDPHREDDIVMADSAANLQTDAYVVGSGGEQPCLVSENVVAASGEENSAVKDNAAVRGGDVDQENKHEDG